tara:strand:+ start:157 stop:315 length:159 start_codon:yes stop_codon:yes gene_type:complete
LIGENERDRKVRLSGGEKVSKARGSSKSQGEPYSVVEAYQPQDVGREFLLPP